jgi:hypothetical protein
MSVTTDERCVNTQKIEDFKVKDEFLVAGRCHRSCRQPQTYVKPEAAITGFELLMTRGVSLETC